MKKILMLVDELYEDIEVQYPKIRLEEEDVSVIYTGLERKSYHGKKGSHIEPDLIYSEINIDEYDGVIIPGGFAPDFFRRYEWVLDLVKKYNSEGKLVAFICHGGWVPVSADILRGRKATGFSAIKDDMVNAGTIWEDSSVVIDNNFVSSRRPIDLGDFCKGILKVLSN
jgi:protease I